MLCAIAFVLFMFVAAISANPWLYGPWVGSGAFAGPGGTYTGPITGGSFPGPGFPFRGFPFGGPFPGAFSGAYAGPITGTYAGPGPYPAPVTGVYTATGSEVFPGFPYQHSTTGYPGFPFWPFGGFPFAGFPFPMNFGNWYEGPNVCKEETTFPAKDDFGELMDDPEFELSSHESEKCQTTHKRAVCVKYIRASDGFLQKRRTSYHCCIGFVRSPDGNGCMEDSLHAPVAMVSSSGSSIDANHRQHVAAATMTSSHPGGAGEDINVNLKVTNVN